MAARVLIVGFDALDARLVQRWAATGRLPAFARALQTFAWGQTENPAAIYAGGVWPSFATGVSPARHGRFYRYRVDREDYVEHAVSPSMMQTPTFWETLSQVGRRVFVFDVPHARLSPEVRGLHLADWCTHEPDLVPGCSSPAALLDELRGRFGQPPPDRCDRTPLERTNAAQLIDELRARIENKVAVALSQLEETRWDLFTVVFCESHCIGHQAWAVHDATHPAHDPAIAALVGDPIETIYRALDSALGRILERAGEDTFVLLFASHGIGPEYNESAVFDDILRRLENVGPPQKAAAHRTLMSASRRLPDSLRAVPWLRQLREHFGERFQARDRGRERMRRSFFEVPHNHNAAAIRINLAGRERQGIVPPRELGAVRERLRDALLLLVNPATNAPVVERVVFTADVFDGPFLDDLPDVFVEWSRREPLTAIGSPELGWFELPRFTQRTGDHAPGGLVAARAPGLSAERLARPVPVTALAPTILQLLGAGHAGMDSEPVAELIAAGGVAQAACKRR